MFLAVFLLQLWELNRNQLFLFLLPHVIYILNLQNDYPQNCHDRSENGTYLMNASIALKMVAIVTSCNLRAGLNALNFV